MSQLLTIQGDDGVATLEVPKSLEQLLLRLSDLGRPRVMLLDSGWHCALDLNTTSPGSEFSVKSEFGLKTPLEAAQQCLERTVKSLRTVTGRL